MLDAEKEKEPESGWTHGEWELGKRMVVEEESGEEVAVREVSLSNMSPSLFVYCIVLTCASIDPSIYLTILSICLSIYLSIDLSIYLSI